VKDLRARAACLKLPAPAKLRDDWRAPACWHLARVLLTWLDLPIGLPPTSAMLWTTWASGATVLTARVRVLFSQWHGSCLSVPRVFALDLSSIDSHI